MAEKNKKNNNAVEVDVERTKANEPETKIQDKTNNNVVTVALKSDLDCKGCVSKVLKCIRSFDGVENATVADGPRISVVGKVDPVKLRERVEKKTHKKVEIILPATTKTAGDKDQKTKENKGKHSSSDKKSKEKKEIPVTTAVLRTRLHCQGCTQKIGRLVSKSKGYREMKIDKEKELVTVTGAMDMNALAKLLKKHLKKEVEILQPKKENQEKKDNGGGEKGKGGGGEKGKGGGGDKGKGGGGDDKGKGGGGDKKKAGGGGDGGEIGDGGGEKVVEANNKSQQLQVGYCSYPMVYESRDVVGQVHYGNPYAPQIFSDENPNACSVM